MPARGQRGLKYHVDAAVRRRLTKLAHLLSSSSASVPLQSSSYSRPSSSRKRCFGNCTGESRKLRSSAKHTLELFGSQ
eukprot:8613988-Pyramimonas_sp.AAC.1